MTERRKPPRLSHVTLYRMFVQEKRTVKEVAQELGTTPGRLRRFCRRHDIPTPTASESRTRVAKRLKEEGKVYKRRPQTLKEMLDKSIKQQKQQANYAPEMILKMAAMRKAKSLTKVKRRKKVGKSKGNALARHISQILMRDFTIEYYERRLFYNKKITVPILLTDEKIIIEIDNCTLFYSTNGEEALKRSIHNKEEKVATFIQGGFHVLRIKCMRPFINKLQKFVVIKRIRHAIRLLKKIKTPQVVFIDIDDFDIDKEYDSILKEFGIENEKD